MDEILKKYLMYKSVRLNDLGVVNAFILNGIPPDFGLLKWATKFGFLNFIKRLVEGHNIDPSQDNNFLLSLAVYYGRDLIFKYLKDHPNVLKQLSIRSPIVHRERHAKLGTEGELRLKNPFE